MLNSATVKNGGCPGGTETYRTLAGSLRYIFGNGGATTVLGGKIALASETAPDLVPPLTITVSTGNNYAVTTTANRCRSKRTANTFAATCS